MVNGEYIAGLKPVTHGYVSLALLTVSNSVLSVAVDCSGQPALPTDSATSSISLDQLARTRLGSLVGSEQGYMEQLYTFSFDERDVSQIVVSYLALISSAPLLAGGACWQPLAELEGEISIQDQVVLDYALLRLRAKIGYTTIAFHLMPESFSLSDLQQTYETILARPIDPRNFRRRMVSSGLLQSENRLRRQGSHRPAALFRFAGNHDPASYLTPDAPPRSGMESDTP